MKRVAVLYATREGQTRRIAEHVAAALRVRVQPIAGALLYQEYGLLKRLVMRMIAKRAGGDTDTSRDHVYTDWEALERFAGQLA